MKRVFLCHASTDKRFVRRLRSRLERAGISPWLDESEIAVGDSLLAQIQAALEHADYVAIILSRQALKRPWVLAELRAAMTLEIRRRKTVVLPLLYERTRLPLCLQDKRYADFTTSFDRGFEELLDAIEPRLKGLQPETLPMDDVDYVKRLQHHLADYRLHTLGVGPGEWGRPPRSYGHILPRNEWLLNIVEPLRDRFQVAQNANGWTLHRYFHHLSSSQALAFNLFLPVYPGIPTSFVATRNTLGLGRGAAEVDFEVVLPDGDGTNIDVLISEGTDRRTVIEVKLTESGFGRAAHDDRHLTKLSSVYMPLLRERLADELLEPGTFFRDYQLLRQLAQLRPMSDDRAVLLLPRARTRLWEHANRWCAQSGLGTFAGRITAVAFEDTLNALLVDAHNTATGLSALTATATKYLAPSCAW